MRSLPFALALAACSSPPTGTSISMDFSRAGGLYDAPFPSDDLARADGTIDLAKVPNPNHVQLIDQALALLADTKGFAQTGGIYFRATGPLDPSSLPDASGSIADGAPLFVVGVDSTKPDFLKKHPVDAAFVADGGPFGAPDLLALLPIQGIPLNPYETYAAVVTTKVRAADGSALVPSSNLQALAAYRQALAAIAPAVGGDQVAALAVFTTGAPTAQLQKVHDAILARPPPSLPAPTRGEVFPDYCVYNTTIQMPVYQAGQPPYSKTGGAWTFDAMGAPIVDHVETARVVFTIPRAPTPPGGWPLVVFVRTGGGGDRPLVDRGVCATEDFTTPIVPGSGPAHDFARVGFAGAQVDGPLGGIRNTTGGDEQFLVFNVFNPAALRDNVRQSAVELVLFGKVAAAAQFDASDCPGASAVRFDGNHVALMGHSMGAWIAPLALSYAPDYRASILSGAGGSYVANVMDKIKPAKVRPIVEILLNYDMDGRSLERHDPALTLIQWAAEPSDPQVYDALVARGASDPRHVLMLQGIVDHYILPSIANATSLALGLDEAGPAYDATNAEEMMLGQTPLGALLPLAGARAISLPASANLDGKTTAVVVQHPGDAIEDGHEVVFQTAPPKHQYRCFLASWLAGAPTVPPDGDEDAPCN